MKHKMNTKERGFTLVEMAVVLLILGLIVGAYFAFLSAQNEEKQQQVTSRRQQKIVASLADFAQRNNRLPCPGEPDAAQLGVSLNAVAANLGGTCISDNERDGIVPFRTLGLTQQDATDGYGNPFTYAVSSDAARQNGNPQVHDNCRIQNTDSWIQAATNTNPEKARFCCPRADVARLTVYSNQTATTRITPVQSIGNFDPSPDTAGPSAVIPNTALAYDGFVVISHGKNASNAFTFGEHDRRVINNIGDGETENADNNEKYVDMPRSTQDGNNYFDDIVVTRTQEALMREFDNDSCAKP